MITQRARELLQHLSRGRVLKRSFSSEFGNQTIYVTPQASLRYWKPGVEHADQESFVFIKKFIRQADVVWDVGANLGVFTLAAAWQAGAEGEVLALEPDPWIYSLLKKSTDIRCEGRASIKTEQLAVSDCCKEEVFHITRKSRSTGHLARVSAEQNVLLTGGVESVQQIQSRTLDALLADNSKPSVIKIDVEGAEEIVLRGAEKVLAEVRPILFCEVKGANTKAITDILLQNHYKLFSLDCDGNIQEISEAVYNTVAIPDEVVKNDEKGFHI